MPFPISSCASDGFLWQRAGFLEADHFICLSFLCLPVASRALGVFKICGPLWWYRSNLFFFDFPVVCLFGDPKLAWDALQGASHAFFLKKKVGRVDDGSSFVISARVFLCFFFTFFLLFLPLSVTFFVFLSLPPLGSLSAFQSLFRFWTHVASAIS